MSQSEADRAVAALVARARLEPGESRQVLASGHYANVVRIDERTGIAVTTDGVGTKLAGRRAARRAGTRSGSTAWR